MSDLYSLHGQFSGCLFLISFLKASNDVPFLNSLKKMFQIFVPRNKILSVLQNAPLTVDKLNCEIFINCNHYFLIKIIVSR